MRMKPSYDLIVTIVNRGHMELIIGSTQEAGAEGGNDCFRQGHGHP